MSDCTICNVCEVPGTFEYSRDSARIASNVKKFRDDEFTVWRCSACGSLHSKEEVDLNHYYDGYFLQSHRLDFHTRLGYGNRLRMLRRHGLRPESRVLDYGCGSGVFVSYLKDRGYPNVFGYDAFVPQYADPQVLSEKFDVVVSFDVIEHVAEPKEYLGELVGTLRPGGLLVIGTPNADQLPLDFKQAMEFHQPFHRHILSERALLDLGRHHGLNVAEVYRRYWLDTLIPSVNTRFVWEYVYCAGGFADVALEPPRVGMVLSSPRLWFYLWFGYFFPNRSNMLVFFRAP